ncbi:MAG: Glutamine-dependent synthetase, partial [Pseudomonadota bacterium]
MTQNLSIMIAQLEFKVGDISHNSNKILHHYQLASDVDLIIFPELALTGYNIKDMAELKIFQENSQTAMIMLAQATKNNKCTMLVGSIYKQGNDLYNAAFHLAQGEIVQIITKRHLPNNAVFDESRIFSPGTQAKHITIGDTKIGVAICEDVWHDDVTDDLIENGAEIIIAINASPFEIDKLTLRADIIKQQVRKHHIPFVYVNSIGGQDELVFDGGSFVIEANGEKTFALACFQEQSQLLSLRKTDSNWHSNALNQLKFPSRNEQMYQAAVLALKSYVQNNNFSGVILGLSGGIDSSLTAAIAVDALGSHSVRGVLMPSPYTTTTSIDDALTLAATLAIQTETISIDELMLATKNSLAQSFAGYEDDIT